MPTIQVITTFDGPCLPNIFFHQYHKNESFIELRFCHDLMR